MICQIFLDEAYLGRLSIHLFYARPFFCLTIRWHFRKVKAKKVCEFLSQKHEAERTDYLRHTRSPCIFCSTPLSDLQQINVFFYYLRSIPYPLLHRHVDLRNPLVPPWGFRWSIPWSRRDERRWSTLSDFQGSWIFCPYDGLSGECLLHHYCRLDPLLHPQHVLQHHRRTTME